MPTVLDSSGNSAPFFLSVTTFDSAPLISEKRLKSRLFTITGRARTSFRHRTQKRIRFDMYIS